MVWLAVKHTHITEFRCALNRRSARFHQPQYARQILISNFKFCLIFVSIGCRFSFAKARAHTYTRDAQLSIAYSLSRSHIQATVNDRAPLTALFNWINKWRTLHTCNAPSHASMIKHSNVFALTLNCFDWNHINTHLNSWNTFFSRRSFWMLEMMKSFVISS